MTFCHSRLLDESLDAIALRESIVILGRPMSGRSTVLQAVTRHLRENGHDPVLIHGVRGLDPALAPLGLAQMVGPTGRGTDLAASGLFTALIDRLGQHDQVLLVDDLDDLDETSVALLEHAVDRTRVAVVATARVGRDDGARLPFPTALRLDMRPLGFEECAELLADHLGAVVEPATVARLMTKSAGLPGLLVRFASAARRAGRLVQRGDLWQATSDLWNPGISRVVAAFLGDLSPDLIAGLVRLARRGACDLDAARALVADGVLRELEERQLIEVTDDEPPVLAISPPLLAEYLRRAATPLVRAITADGDAAEVDPATGMSEVFGPAALLQARQRRVHALAQARWDGDHGPGAAADLIRALIARGVDRREVLRVIEHTDPDAGPPDESQRYREVVARWHAWVDADLPSAAALLDGPIRGPDADRARLGAARLASHLASVTAEPWVPRHSGGASASGPAEAVVEALVVGDGQRAATLLAALPEPIGAEGHTERALWRVQAAALRGEDLDHLLAVTREHRSRALADLDAPGAALHAHAQTTGLFLQGRFAEAEAVLDAVLAIGVPPFPHMPVQVGSLTMLAALQARRGRFDLADSTQRQAERFGIVHSYLPFGSTQWSRAYIDALRDGEAGLSALWEAGLALEHRGFLPAALAVWSFGIGPWSAHRLDHLHQIADQGTHPLFAPMVSYQEALASRDPAVLDRAFHALRTAHRPFFAGVIARSLAALHRHDEPVAEHWRSRAHALADEVGCTPLDLTPGRSLRTAVTPREQDILRLVVAGRSNTEIAANCFLSVRTVENHVHRIIRKLGVPSRADLGEVWK